MDLRLHVLGYPDSDSEEQADLAWSLREELLELNVDGVTRPTASPIECAKGSPLEWAQLVVALAGALPPVIAALRSWLGRHPGSAVTVEIDGDRLTLGEPTDSERRELIHAWIKRHGG